MTTFKDVCKPGEDEQPSSRAQDLATKASWLLLLFLCVSPIALFPVALACKVYAHFFP